LQPGSIALSVESLNPHMTGQNSLTTRIVCETTVWSLNAYIGLDVHNRGLCSATFQSTK
jgi:hypothetical protein